MLALGLAVLGCSQPVPNQSPVAFQSPASNESSVPNGGSVPLDIDDAVSVDNCCVLAYTVMDVAADPDAGTVDKASGRVLRWPLGFTARWAGAEVEVLDPTGKVVLTTGRRYYVKWAIDPGYTLDVVGNVRPCDGCELNGGPL